ncbi:MAG TPA: alpha-amylase family glycosyl hydrolase [Geminicoccus sp.]|uniref:alpha-amylase family glycosyl hydrolase n=1 Tax=Geminicoccus sp. TaxID=2024832 RepID=UPI002E335525|nr:alpha-amylase family glycosyl hydrolase [Geminicoccus sp.]HEX2525176.1 alpha-amylase family glycosyl hydrolase [Geminicoccus sp.]
MVEKSLSELDWDHLRAGPFTASPADWGDQVFYFLLLDRFSDNNEAGYKDVNDIVVAGGTTPLFQLSDNGNAVQSAADAAQWREAGAKWAGGTLNGLASKLGYLKRLGISAIWISPVFKQVSFQQTYHGYGVQHFLDVDPHFGTRDDLRNLVQLAHQSGIYIVLDIIINHAGNVFDYSSGAPDWNGQMHDVRGFNDATGKPALPFGSVDLHQRPDAFPHDAIWPSELQQPPCFTQKGRIRDNGWDNFPETLEGDFYDLKDIHLGKGPIDDFRPSPALLALVEAYKFWIASADIDGLRVDTVKHMDLGATRFIAAVLHEFAQSLGKENFLLLGEITGGRENAFNTLEATGLDAALGIADEPGKLEGLVKGFTNPEEYFEMFRNSFQVGKQSHTWFRNKVVTILDDHDQVRKGNNKARFCAGNAEWPKLVFNALALNVTTLGIPCIYYGTEQCFDGEGGNDRYIREAMFGRAFGAFRSKDRHFFDENDPVYRELAKVIQIRKQKIALRRGRQYLREISGNGVDFGFPRIIGDRMLSVVPWSRIFDDREVLLAINTNSIQAQTTWVVVDSDLNVVGKQFTCLYSSDPAQIGQKVNVKARQTESKTVQLTVPAAGFVIYE